MNYEWQIIQRPQSRPAAATLPPPLIEEMAWDILLALHSDEGCKLTLDKLASAVSAPEPTLKEWLAKLEERRLITGAVYGVEQEIRAVLTLAGRELLDHYLYATSDLQIVARY